MRFFAGMYIVLTVLSYIAAITHSSRASAVSLPARTVTAPAAATIGAGASLRIVQPVPESDAFVQKGEEEGPALNSSHADSVSLDEKGGDPSPASQVGHEALAPAGVLSSAPAGAFVNQLNPAKPSQVDKDSNFGCQCGPNCPCCNLKKPAENFNVASELKTAVAARPAPVRPVPAPAAVSYMPAYWQPSYPLGRPTFTSYYQSSCGPGGCGPVRRGLFGRGR